MSNWLGVSFKNAFIKWTILTTQGALSSGDTWHTGTGVITVTPGPRHTSSLDVALFPDSRSWKLNHYATLYWSELWLRWLNFRVLKRSHCFPASTFKRAWCRACSPSFLSFFVLFCVCVCVCVCVRVRVCVCVCVCVCVVFFLFLFLFNRRMSICALFGFVFLLRSSLEPCANERMFVWLLREVENQLSGSNDECVNECLLDLLRRHGKNIIRHTLTPLFHKLKLSMEGDIKHTPVWTTLESATSVVLKRERKIIDLQPVVGKNKTKQNKKESSFIATAVRERECSRVLGWNRGEHYSLKVLQLYT